jgi:hypothetical protein
MNELFLYDRDEGLFKKILDQSKVIGGRYFIVSSGFDFNNMPLDFLKQKYPCVLLKAPKSYYLPPDFTKQTLQFELHFLTRHGVTGQNQVKEAHPDTLNSQHPVWYDWKDMNEVAGSFINMLLQVIKSKYVGDKPLRGLIGLDKSTIYTERISRAGNDEVSGVKLAFSILQNYDCDAADYVEDAIDLIEVPDTNIHPLHKH